MAEAEHEFESFQDESYLDDERARKLARGLFDDLSGEPVRLTEFVRRGEAEPELSGIRVVDKRVFEREDGEIRAINAIKEFLHRKSRPVSEAVLVERLTAAGFGEKKARIFIQKACDDNDIISVNEGRLYRLAE